MQKPFSTLSQGGQTRRMTFVARKALEAYAVPVARLSLSNKFTTRIFASWAERRTVHAADLPPRRTSVEVVRSELLWLAALSQDTDLNVPKPVLNKERQYATVISDENFPQPCLCALFHWTKGRFLYRSLTPSHLFQVGELTARLHQHAAHWDRPAGFTRRRVDNLFCLRQEQDDRFDEAVAARLYRLSQPPARRKQVRSLQSDPESAGLCCRV
jgi:hypothetical protein